MTNIKKNNSPGKAVYEEKDKEWILDLYNFMCQEGLVDLELEESGCRITIKRYKKNHSNPGTLPLERRSAGTALEPSPEAPQKKPAESSHNASFITSPLIGTFYRSTSPTTEPFVKQGEKVDTGRVLCIVEAMKVMNEIRAEKDCRIKKICMENGKPVTAGQHLFEVEWT